MVKTINNIQIDYKHFLEYTYTAYSLLSDLYPKTNEFLQDYCKKEEYDKEFAYRFEIFSLNIERILFEFNNLVEEIEKTYLPKMKILEKEPKIKRNPWEDVLIFYPRWYEEDIYVNSEDKIDWDKLR